MDMLKQHGAIGAAIAMVSGLGAYLLPVPHAYAQIYFFVFGPAGAFIGTDLRHYSSHGQRGGISSG